MEENLTRHADSRISERRRDFFKIQIQSEFATDSRDYTRISHKMTVNGYLLFDSIQINQRTNTHEYREKRAIIQQPHRSAIRKVSRRSIASGGILTLRDGWR